ALLAVRRGGVVSNDALVEALWDGRPPPTAAKNVQIYVSQLRKALSEHAIETRGNGYSLLLDPDHLDIARFESLVEQGRESLARGDNDAASATLGEALTLWRGPAVAGFAYAEFAQVEIARLEELRLAAVEDRIDADLALGRQRRLVPELEVLVRSYPVRERFREQLMLALYRSGRQAEALEAFREARRAFVEELGIEPSRSLQAIERQILEQDPELDSPRRRSTARLPRRRRVLLVGGLLVAGAATAVAVAFSGGSNAVHVEINAVGVVDPTKNEVVAQVPVGVNPVAIALSQ